MSPRNFGKWFSPSRIGSLRNESPSSYTGNRCGLHFWFPFAASLSLVGHPTSGCAATKKRRAAQQQRQRRDLYNRAALLGLLTMFHRSVRRIWRPGDTSKDNLAREESVLEISRPLGRPLTLAMPDIPSTNLFWDSCGFPLLVGFGLRSSCRYPPDRLNCAMQRAEHNFYRLVGEEL